MPDLSILIPARNEMFLARTIEDILENRRGKTEVIAVCDGEWPKPRVADHPDVHLIYHSKSIGQRAATNEAARLSKAKFIMKCDAHCAFAEGFDLRLMEDCRPDWTMVPQQRNLHAFNWLCKECGNETYQGPTPKKCEKCGTRNVERKMIWQPRRGTKTDAWRFDSNLKFQYWKEFRNRAEGQGEITDTMSLLGACWLMHRERYWELDGLDEEHGSWGQMGTEIACKTWLSGGRLCTNKRTWFAHMFRTQGGDFSFPYRITSKETSRARKHSNDIWKNNKWPKAKYPLSWLIEKFAPIPGWENYQPEILKTANTKKQTIGMVYYTDNHADHGILEACRRQIMSCVNGHEIISVSQQPLVFGRNIVMNIERSKLSMFKQILRGLEESTADVVFLLEHDLYYHPSHFNFRPPRTDTFYYDRNRWAVDPDTGKAVFYHTNLPSMMCASRELLIDHYRRKVAFTEKEGFKSRYGYSPPKGLPKENRVGGYDTYFAEYPTLDIRHSQTLTKKRMSKDQFRSEQSCRGWTEAYEVPGWGKVKPILDNMVG